jgi:DNA replication protein DnaC
MSAEAHGLAQDEVGDRTPLTPLSRPYEQACPLGACDGSGFLIDEDTSTASDCRCRSGRIAAARTRSLAGRIPSRYQGVSFERPPVSDLARSAPHQVELVRSYVARVEKNLDRGRGLWIQGDVGTGKTTLAMLVSKAALQVGRSVAIYSLPRLLNAIRETAHRVDRSHLALLDRLTAVDLLHIDDVGAERTTDWVLEELYSIVDARYEDERSMVITTNLEYEELCTQISGRTASRLAEMCDRMPLEGEDRRVDPYPRLT